MISIIKEKNKKILGSMELFEKVKTSSDGTKEYYYDPFNYKYVGLTGEARRFWCHKCNRTIAKEEIIVRNNKFYHEAQPELKHDVVPNKEVYSCYICWGYFPKSEVINRDGVEGHIYVRGSTQEFHPVSRQNGTFYWCPICRRIFHRQSVKGSKEEGFFHSQKQILHPIFPYQEIVCQAPSCPICGKPGTCETAWGYCSEEHKTEMMDSLKNIMMVDEHDS